MAEAMSTMMMSRMNAIFGRAVARGLRLVCANPDHWRFGAGGSLLPAPGAFAERYAAMGGDVQWHGKPHPHIYETALESLAVPKDRVLCVGDSMHHDVRGAAEYRYQLTRNILLKFYYETQTDAVPI